MSISQKNIFLSSEGDSFFKRNKSAIENEGKTDSYKFYMNYLNSGSRILEIGCSAGANLNYLQEKLGCECYGIDPSSDAIEYGSTHYKNIKFSVGTADNLKFEDGYFDFVLFGFCLYLIDRNLLARTIAESDRVLKDKGFLGITDFDVKIPRARTYKHYEGIMSYKMDYGSLFLAFPHYSLVDKYSYSHSTDYFVEDINERVSSLILFKDHENAYIKE